MHQVRFLTSGRIAWTTPQEVLSAFKGSYEEAVQKSVAI
jgi:hypothetical protein